MTPRDERGKDTLAEGREEFELNYWKRRNVSIITEQISLGLPRPLKGGNVIYHIPFAL